MKKFLRFLDPDFYADKVKFKLHEKFPKGKRPVHWMLVDWFVEGIFYLVAAFVLYNSLGFVLGTTAPLVVVTSGSMEPVFYRGDVMILTGANEISAPEVTLSRSVENLRIRDYAALNYEGSGECEVFVEPYGRAFVSCPTVESISFESGETIPITTDGDVIVYFSSGGNEIIHRAVAKMNTPDGVFLLTKGDNLETNKTVDQDCVSRTARGEEFTFCAVTDYAIPADLVVGKSVFRIPLVGYLKLILFGQ